MHGQALQKRCIVINSSFLLQGISSFIQLAKKSGVCIAVSVTINRNADDEEFDDVVETLLNQDKARVIRI